jgi:protein SCO1/2
MSLAVRHAVSLALAAAILAAPPRQAAAQEAVKVVREVGIDQKLGDRVALDLPFTDESGGEVRLGDFFGQRPVLLALVYYRCPMLCSQVLDGIVRTLRAVSLEPGSDFEIVIVSIDPKETSDLAAEKKASCVAQYGRKSGAQGWHFLVGTEASIHRLAADAGFRYLYDPRSGQFAHASGFFVLTPRGVLSRYFYGLEHASGDLRLALVESSEERIGSLVDQVLLLCYHYDPTTGRYGFVILNVIRALGLFTVAAIAVFLWLMLRRDRAAPRTEAGG